MLTGLGAGIAALTSVAVPLAVVWGALGVWLGRRQEQQARRDAGSMRPHEAPAPLRESPADAAAH